ncbi:MAG: RNase A-like domain-containing protein [Terriglobales bacterium]
MKRSSISRFFAISAVLATCVLIACQTPTSTNSASSSAATGSATLRVESQATNGPRRDLSRDEAQGGHILRKHVAQTEEQLRQRLERERNITGASTYTDRSTAERAVGSAIAQSQSEIQNWLIQPGRHPNLVLDYDSEVPIGRTMNRGEYQSRVCEHAIVVLKYNGPNHYYVLTSYPECRS